MAAGYLLTPAAARDLDGIFTFILEQGGPRRAVDVHKEFVAALDRIAAWPGLAGHRREDLADEALCVFALHSYLVIYRPDTRPVQIIRVIHGARQFPEALGEEA